jgi:hypothetical protein
VARDLAIAKQDPQGPAIARTVHSTPTSGEVWRALERIGKSVTMKRAERLIQLLNFLVETTLSGNGHYLKETTIGVSVFGRSPDYDPKTDTIVRSQAWRLRAKLSDYYATEGSEETVIISVPKGQYAAVFNFRDGSSAEPSAVSPEGRSRSPRR